MAVMMKLLGALFVCFLALAENHTIHATPTGETISSVFMGLCTQYGQGKTRYGGKCQRELTDILKEQSGGADQFITAADTKALCTGEAKDGYMMRFQTACGVFAHLCDFMQISEIRVCPEAKPLFNPLRRVRRQMGSASNSSESDSTSVETSDTD